jgi:hypothetical protein
MAPSRHHEIPLVLLSERTAAARALWAAVVGRAAREGSFEQADTSVSLEHVRTLLADRVWLLRGARGEVVRVGVVEAQRQWDRSKPRVWGALVGALQGQYGCPVDLLVITGSQRVRRRLARPVRFGSVTVHPHAVTSEDLAAAALGIAEASTAASLAIAAIHVDKDILEAKHVEALVRSVTARSPDRALTAAFADALLGVAERFPSFGFHETLEALMLDLTMFEDGSIMASKLGRQLLREYVRRERADAEQSALARAAAERAAAERAAALRSVGRALVRVLEKRGLAPTESHRARIEACTDREVLEAWFERAFDVVKADDVFAG